MSNVIKGHTVRYNEEKLILDFNDKAEEIKKKFLEDHPRTKVEKNAAGSSEDGFIAGLNALNIDLGQKALELTAEQLEQLNEQRVSDEDYAAKRREEIEIEMQKLIAQAEEEAAVIIKNAKAQAQKDKLDVFNKAKDDGYKEGLKKGEKEINSLKAGLEKDKSEFKAEHERMMKEVEPQAVSLIIALIHKLTGVLLEDRKEIIFYLIQQALSGADQTSCFIIKVSKEDYKFLSSKKDELLNHVKAGTEIEIVEDALLKKSQCLIDADSRYIDLSLDVQLHNLTEHLKMLSVLGT